MSILMFVLYCCPLIVCASPKHVIVLMLELSLENRAFDHMFGYLPGVDGVVGKNLSNSDGSLTVGTSNNAPMVNDCDPNHGIQGTGIKIFGRDAWQKQDLSNPDMSGFIQYENGAQHASEQFCNVMQGFSPDAVPVASFLAQEYAIFDKFFCSVQGPTWPNRQFMLSGTSMGQTSVGPWYLDKTGSLFPQRTIFDQVEAAGLHWKSYYGDTPWELFMEKIADNPGNLFDMSEFHRDCASSELPAFSWINPRSGLNLTSGDGPNDQHPDHDVAWGEMLLKQVYDSVRSSPAWQDTVLLITWDEGGGFYDHVAPPNYAPNPNPEIPSYPDKGFKFDKLGMRVPLIAVSPLIPRGTVVGAAPRNAYDLTSILGSTRDWLGIEEGPLSARDAWSDSFSGVLSLEAPRRDAPLRAPQPRAPSVSLEKHALQAHSDLQNHILRVTSTLAGKTHPNDDALTAHEVSWLNVRYWKQLQQKLKRTPLVVCTPCLQKGSYATDWWVNETKSGYYTVSTADTHKCLSTSLRLLDCGTTAGQFEWTWDQATFRDPLNDQSCLTVFAPNNTLVAMTPCNDSVTQHFSLGKWGPAAKPWEVPRGAGNLFYGNFVWCLSASNTK